MLLWSSSASVTVEAARRPRTVLKSKVKVKVKVAAPIS
jgi:hypothetical protein